MPRARRIRGGLASPVIAALINSMPDPGALWPFDERQRWLSALQAALNLAYRQADPPGVQTLAFGGAVPGSQYVHPGDDA
jgi:hypothetical protein